jgi:Ca2+-binding RTX toxin-like protein
MTGLGLATGAILPAGVFGGAGASTAHDSSDRIVYDTSSGKLYYDSDGNVAGGHPALQFALLFTHPALDASDFQIV